MKIRFLKAFCSHLKIKSVKTSFNLLANNGLVNVDCSVFYNFIYLFFKTFINLLFITFKLKILNQNYL